MKIINRYLYFFSPLLIGNTPATWKCALSGGYADIPIATKNRISFIVTALGRDPTNY